jgi:ATP-dependent Lhr-like helicase
VDTVIIDEIHALVPTKRGAHLALSLERLEAFCDRPPQRIGLSATQRPLDEVARFLGGSDAVGQRQSSVSGARGYATRASGQRAAREASASGGAPREIENEFAVHRRSIPTGRSRSSTPARKSG